MKRVWTAALAGVVAMSLSFSVWAGVKPDQKAPGFKLPAATGKVISLDSFKGKYVVLEWLNHGCPFVKKHYKSNNMQALQKKFTKKGVVWLSIVSSAPGKQGHMSPKKTLKVAKAKGAAATHILLDPSGKVGKLYGARTTPHMFVLNPKQTVIYAGAIDSKRGWDPAEVKTAKNYVAAALHAALKGKKVKVKQTPPYGCSVKYKW
jgi:peroxiredoxin